jgi:hypothetical protein
MSTVSIPVSCVLALPAETFVSLLDPVSVANLVRACIREGRTDLEHLLAKPKGEELQAAIVAQLTLAGAALNENKLHAAVGRDVDLDDYDDAIAALKERGRVREVRPHTYELVGMGAPKPAARAETKAKPPRAPKAKAAPIDWADVKGALTETPQTCAQVAAYLKADVGQVKRALAKMVKDGLAVAVGQGRWTKYVHPTSIPAAKPNGAAKQPSLPLGEASPS